MKRSTKHQLALVLLAVLPAIGCASSALASSNWNGGHGDMEVVTAGNGIGTTLREVVFEGQVVCRANGTSRPLSQVTFTRHEKPNREPRTLEIDVDSSGRFSSELRLVTTLVGRKKLKRGSTIVVEAPGCRATRVHVDDDWTYRVIPLECPCGPPAN